MFSGLISIIIVLVLLHAIRSQGIVGTVAKCDKEGQKVFVPLISDNPCISCFCKRGQIMCMQEVCQLEGCHMVLFNKPKDSCCNQCKGCVYEGKRIPSGKEMIKPGDPCTVMTCQTAVLSIRQEQCHVPCKNPIKIPGQCCPSCSGCALGRRKIKEGGTLTLKRDRCVECVCKAGSVTCTKKSCPILNCPNKYIYHPKNACCPLCREQRTVFDLPTRCLLKNKVYKDGESVQVDRCTNCICQNATSVCRRTSCPPITCSAEYIIYESGKCCPRCQLQRRCRWNGRWYRHGKSWTRGLCTKCSCDNGTTRCQTEQCRNALGCPKNYELKYRKGTCCPRCIEKESRCTVFGDPHYKSFDGSIFNYQGTCKYILAQDCRNQAFSVRVRNYSRMANSYAWTKFVVLHIGGLKLSLLQNLIVKYNKRRVQLPFIKDGVLVAEQTGRSIEVRTNIGVKLFWDGDSFLEVTVPAKFKGRMCGLCGNYNGIDSDDFIGRDNLLHSNAQSFGDTWMYGTSRACQKTTSSNENQCEVDKERQRQAEERCGLLKSKTFRVCHDVVDVHSYVGSCIIDECDCPKSRTCACETFKAYARACNNKGVQVQWEKVTSCSGDVCPRGSKFEPCGASCQRTCGNVQSTKTACSSECQPGCTCPVGRVMHDNACILPKNCPR